MSTDLFRVGRGGAGNWYSKKDLDSADKRDVEAQTPTLPAAAEPSAPASGPAYVRGGRGGAGNFYDTAAAVLAARDEATEAVRLQAERGVAPAAPATAATAAAAAPSPAPPVSRSRPGLSGRGGAGNWTASAAEIEAAAAEDRRRKQAVLEAQVQQDVEAGLPMPPRAYHTTPEERERKK